MKLLIVVASLALFAGGFAGVATERADGPGHTFHVAVGGDDGATGGPSDPFATLERARDAVRELQPLPAGGVTVLIHEGNYERGESFELDERDSGADDAPIVYRAADGADVRISGGRSIPGSAAVPVSDQEILERLPEESRSHVMRIDLWEHGVTTLGELRDYGYGRGTNPAPAELFIDDLPLDVASWPDDGRLAIGDVVDPGSNPSVGERDNRGATFVLETARLQRWALADQAFVEGFFFHGWAHDAVRADSIDLEQSTVTLASATQYGVQSGQTWSTVRVTNLLEEIDRPGEYFIDHETGIAYVYPRQSLAVAKVQVSLLESPLFSIIGASHVEVSGLTFENSRGMGIYLEGGEQVQLNGNEFQNLGEVAVSVGRGYESPAFLGDPAPRSEASNIVGAVQSRLASNNAWNRNGGTGHQIVSNDVRNTGAGGILVGSGDRPTLAPANIRVVNNDVRGYNRWLTTQAPGIWANGAGMLVEHNLVGNAPQRAIFANGNLHTVRKNEVYGAVRDADDVGAIGMYRDPSEFGNVFEHNFIHDNGSDYGAHGTQGIFLDDGTSGQVVRGNVFVRAGSNYAIKLHGGRHNVIENNIFVDTPTGVGLATWSDARWQDQLNSPLYQTRLLQDVDIREEPFLSAYPILATYVDEDGVATSQPPDSNLIENNLTVGVGQLSSNNTATFGDNYETDEDPGFADPANLDYSLDPESPVFDALPGFEPIPFDEIGLYIDAHRTALDADLGSFSLLLPRHGTQNVDPLAPPMLEWEPSLNADGYRVQLAISSNYAEPVLDVRTTEPRVSIEGLLTHGNVYTWRVTAESQSRSRAGERVHEGSANAFRTPDVSEVPTSPELTVRDASPGSVALTWPPVPQATRYTVVRALAEVGGAFGPAEVVFQGDATELVYGAQLAFTDADAPMVLDIRYSVIASNSLGDSDASERVTVSAETLIATEDDFSEGINDEWSVPDGFADGRWTPIQGGSEGPRLRLSSPSLGSATALVVDSPDGAQAAVSAGVDVRQYGPRGGGGAGLIALADADQYRLTLVQGGVRLEGVDGTLVSAPVDPAGVSRLTLAFADGAVYGLVDDRVALQWHTDTPFVPMQVGLVGHAVLADFNDVRVISSRWGPPPEGWMLRTYGERPTFVSVEDDSWTIRAVGADVFGVEDEFGFVYQPVTRPAGGQVVITARVESLEHVADTTMAGVMIREHDTSVSANVFTRTVSVGSNQTTVRFLPAYPTEFTSVAGLGRPIELRLVWLGSTITSFYRLPGDEDWTLHTENEVHFDDSVLVGVGVASKEPDVYTEAVLSHVEVTVIP